MYLDQDRTLVVAVLELFKVLLQLSEDGFPLVLVDRRQDDLWEIVKYRLPRNRNAALWTIWQLLLRVMAQYKMIPDYSQPSFLGWLGISSETERKGGEN